MTAVAGKGGGFLFVGKKKDTRGKEEGMSERYFLCESITVKNGRIYTYFLYLAAQRDLIECHQKSFQTRRVEEKNLR